MQIGEKIKNYRKTAGLTQEQVADYLDVSTPAVNKWEKGNTYPMKLPKAHSQIVQSLFLSILHEMKIVHSYQFLIIEQLPEVMIYLDMCFLFPIYLPQE